MLFKRSVCEHDFNQKYYRNKFNKCYLYESRNKTDSGVAFYLASFLYPIL